MSAQPPSENRDQTHPNGPISAVQSADGRAPKVGVIYNPRSHRNRGQDLDSNPAPHVFISQPGDRSQLSEALERFVERGIDLLVINGGDGTVRDVLTAGGGVFGDKWPVIAVLPKGKTNALTVDLGAPKDWSLQGAIDAYLAGGRMARSPLIVEPIGATGGKSHLGFILGAGVFTMAISAGQDAHRLGAFNGLAVGVTTVWSMLQSLFGGRTNKWRRGLVMDLQLDEDRKALPHSGLGETDRRVVLFASTLEKFPAGIQPFGDVQGDLKMVVLDQIKRRSLLRLPLNMMGKDMSNLAQRGIHQVAADSFTMALDDEFILDGEAYPAGTYTVKTSPPLQFVRPL